MLDMPVRGKTARCRRAEKPRYQQALAISAQRRRDVHVGILLRPPSVSVRRMRGPRPSPTFRDRRSRLRQTQRCFRSCRRSVGRSSSSSDERRRRQGAWRRMDPLTPTAQM